MTPYERKMLRSGLQFLSWIIAGGLCFLLPLLLIIEGLS
jgi:hypothetical protein